MKFRFRMVDEAKEVYWDKSTDGGRQHGTHQCQHSGHNTPGSNENASHFGTNAARIGVTNTQFGANVAHSGVPTPQFDASPTPTPSSRNFRYHSRMAN